MKVTESFQTNGMLAAVGRWCAFYSGHRVALLVYRWMDPLRIHNQYPLFWGGADPHRWSCPDALHTKHHVDYNVLVREMPAAQRNNSAGTPFLVRDAVNSSV